jgi:hypothetical protein
MSDQIPKTLTQRAKDLLNTGKENPVLAAIVTSIVLTMGATTYTLRDRILPQPQLVTPEIALQNLDIEAEENMKKSPSIEDLKNENIKEAVLQFNKKFKLWTIKDSEVVSNGDILIYLHLNAPDEYSQFDQAAHDRLREEEKGEIAELFEGNEIYSQRVVTEINGKAILNGEGDQGRTISSKDLPKFIRAVMQKPDVQRGNRSEYPTNSNSTTVQNAGVVRGVETNTSTTISNQDTESENVVTEDNNPDPDLQTPLERKEALREYYRQL